MIVASLGIACGAVFSSGLMEVAQKGIFVPGEFMFSEIMIIFMAVMITDILLLDFFNTLGMPTSTTVSIVFELLGRCSGYGLDQNRCDRWFFLGSRQLHQHYKSYRNYIGDFTFGRRRIFGGCSGAIRIQIITLV